MRLKTIAVAALCLLTATNAFAQGSHRVRGYTRQDGTYVAPHVRTNPNSTRTDNWSTRGNVNPYTGREGTKSAYEPYSSARTRPNKTPDTTYQSPY